VGGGRSALPALVFGGPAGSLGERGAGRVRWRERRNAGGGCSALPACVFGGPAGSLCGSSRIETPAACGGEEGGSWAAVCSMVFRRHFGSGCCGYGAAAAGIGKMVKWVKPHSTFDRGHGLSDMKGDPAIVSGSRSSSRRCVNERRVSTC
jgi:hypothetical protein